jgi:S-DNA-T family DNA segregation ATPase FtsK/SpoIIIE
MLPTLLPYAELLASAGGGGEPTNPLSFAVGVAEADLRPVSIDFTAEAHLLIFGDGESGKTALLRCLAAAITNQLPPDRARIVIIDYRRGMLGAAGTEHLIGYGTTAEDSAQLIASVAGYMARRRPGPHVTADQLRSRSWWQGPECFVLVDDYDLVTAGGTNPLLPLIDHLAQAKDVGLHLILARRTGGAGRALFEPLLQRLRELGSAGVVLSGDRDEGPLVGTVRPGVQPPGRGYLVTRREGARLIQFAWLDLPHG